MIRVGSKNIGEDQPVFIIAEAGVNHNGDLKLAKELVDAAVEAKVDAIKFQTFNADKLVTYSAPKAKYQETVENRQENQYEMLKKIELSADDFREISAYCEKRDVVFLSTPFDFDSIELLESLNVELFKVSSGDLNNLPLLKSIASKKKPIILSTGMASLGEIEEAVNICHICPLVLLHCTSNYPTKYSDVNLRAMLTLKHAFKLPVGYSDHTVGIEVALAAVSMGAIVIEKHFTLDRNLPGPDHKVSLDPTELQNMVKSIRNIESAFGNGIKGVSEGEKEMREVARKSIVAAVDIPTGTTITKEMLAIKRPAGGIAPKYLDLVIGRSTKEDIHRDEYVTWVKLI